jgi:hypothetical protein
MNNPVLKDTLIGEEWMALRQVASGGQDSELPHSVRRRLVFLGLAARDNLGRLMLTEKGRRLIETPD